MSNLEKPIKIKLLKEVEDYVLEQNEKIQKKFLLVFEKTERRIKGRWFEKLKNTDGIYEFRISDHQKFYRLFAFWDSEETETLIIGTHGINKKTNKTPQNEIQKAERLKKRYLDDKNK